MGCGLFPSPDNKLIIYYPKEVTMKKLLLTLLALPSLAAFADVFGGYGEIQAGSANSSAFNSGINNSGAMRIDGGVKFDQYIGLEAGFTGLTNPTAGNVNYGPIQFYDASFKASLPVSEYFSFHGQIGAAYGVGATEVSRYDATPKGLVGAGFDVALNKNLALTVNDYGYLDFGLNPNSGVGGNTNVVMGGLKVNF
jgi:hypothetical protein